MNAAPLIIPPGPLVHRYAATAFTRQIQIDFQNPNYADVFRDRMRLLAKLDSNPAMVTDFKAHYRLHPADFVQDWGVTIDPRVAGVPGRTPLMPFILMPKQLEWFDWMEERWLTQTPGCTEKSRDCGLSWLATTWSVSKCLFWGNINIGFGSAKEDKVDRSGDPDCLFYKMRLFIKYIPRCFRNGWDTKRNSQHMRLSFPGTDSSIVGEAGDNIGRGGRTAATIIDESAHLERPKLVDASLAATTDCRIDISSVNGTANSFAERVHGGKIPVFTFHWRDDPRKGPVWAEKKQAEVDPIVWAAEYELNYSASVDGVIIPQTHVQAALDLDKLLGLTASGQRSGALDISDLGKDKCALAGRYGFLLENIVSWRGNGIIQGREWGVPDTVRKAVVLCDEWGLTRLLYDADGLGATARDPLREANEARAEARIATIPYAPFRGSAGVVDPEKVFPGTTRKAIDYFENFKAQSWWWLRQLFANSYKAYLCFKATGKLPPDFDETKIIVLRDGTPEIRKLCMELSQPTWVPSKTGKVCVDKMPDDTASPNLADAVMMAWAPRRLSVVVKQSHLEQHEN